jgi:hypothetical protein
LWYLFTKRGIKQTVVIIEAYGCCQLHTKLYPVFSSPYAGEIIGDHHCGFLSGRSIIFSLFGRYWRKKCE